MRYLEYPARRPLEKNHHRITLLIGAACATSIGLARGQAETRLSDTALPGALRLAPSLSAPDITSRSGKPKTEWQGLTRELSSGLKDEPAPLILRTSRTLSKAGNGNSTRKPLARSADEAPRLSMTPWLLERSDNSPKPGERPSQSMQAIAGRSRIPSSEAPITDSVSRPDDRPSRAAQAKQDMAETVGPSPPVPFEAVRSGPPATASPTTTSPSDGLPDLASIGWTVPPIRWGGNTTSNYNWNGSSGGGSTFSETQALNLRASSYIYQPWYAQVSGDFGVLSGTSKQSGGDSSSGNASRSTSFTYGGNLSLFPQSRFPFQAFLQTSDSRASANETNTNFTTLRMGARQNYRPETGPGNYSASADRSIVTTNSVSSTVDALQGSVSTAFGSHAISSSARYSRNTGDVGGQTSNLLSLTGTHSWRDDEELSVASSAAFSNNEIRMLTPTGLSLNKSQVMQAGSSVTWVPDEDLPLSVSGGGNFLQMNTETETAKSNLSSFSGYANANYRFSQNLSANAGMTLAQIQSSGSNQLSSGQNASVSYSGNPLTIGDYSYNWGTGGGISNQMITGGTANRSISAQAQHSLGRSVVLNPASTVSVNASQSYSLSNNSGSGQSGVLTHAGGASWRLALGERTLGSLSATASDSIASGKISSHVRSFATQGNIQTQLTGRSALTGSINISVNQQVAGSQTAQTVTPGDTTSGGTTTTTSGSGQVSYSHRSPFDIANLLYTATLQFNASQTNLRVVTGDPNALSWQTGTTFQQNVDYRLGRLMFRGTGSFASFNGKENASVFFMIGRELGDF